MLKRYGRDGYDVLSVTLDGFSILEGEHFTVDTEAFCADCGAEVFVPEFSDFNLRALYDVFRKENGIISLEQIREIPEKYAIGKRPLSLLLGWGLHLSTRFGRCSFFLCIFSSRITCRNTQRL